MRQFLFLITPTVLIYIGLHVFSNVPLTFLLFYSWLLIIPLLNGGVPSFSRITLEKLGWKFSNKSMTYGIISGVFFFVVIFGGLSLLHDFFFNMEHLRSLLDVW
ncbi:hypothetical protein [Evansella tamaricis]|uniref:Uncharacterized protein n=1 Tax=Evansella tamaricis TaxID=2069301 RepID=A0ABS6JCZ3_9BACI|nr:hypothetical protein [Evansella tamaricis]MBU9711538.1 hypothetical protein [Evansella tamaricis]